MFTWPNVYRVVASLSDFESALIFSFVPLHSAFYEGHAIANAHCRVQRLEAVKQIGFSEHWPHCSEHKHVPTHWPLNTNAV